METQTSGAIHCLTHEGCGNAAEQWVAAVGVSIWERVDETSAHFSGRQKSRCAGNPWSDSKLTQHTARRRRLS